MTSTSSYSSHSPSCLAPLSFQNRCSRDSRSLKIFQKDLKGESKQPLTSFWRARMERRFRKSLSTNARQPRVIRLLTVQKLQLRDNRLKFRHQLRKMSVSGMTYTLMTSLASSKDSPFKRKSNESPRCSACFTDSP